MQMRKMPVIVATVVVVAMGMLQSHAETAPAQSATAGVGAPWPAKQRRVTQAQREAAAQRAAALRAAQGNAAAAPDIGPGDTPDYFGTTPNYANSPLPWLDPTRKNAITGGIRKFVDSLPGVGEDNANNLGQCIPAATPDTLTYGGADYYEISLVEYTEQMHSDLPPSKLRGYVQTNNGTDPATNENTIAPAPVHYLGPLIIARRNRPVRIKFTNSLPTGEGGDLFIPTDTTIMGAGMGPDEENSYTQNRGTIHLHGGQVPWISDGTPHQWITPEGEITPYVQGVSAEGVPDMPPVVPGDGTMTFYYPNQQSARLMFYHDHAFGITRLNVYVGEAAGYLVTDDAEEQLINSGALPGNGMGVYRYGIPLIIQDKSFVPSNEPNPLYPEGQLTAQDPTWDTTKWGGMGNLWFPHVYMTNQNPEEADGMNPMGRWDYGPWFWPPFNAGAGLVNGPVPNPYADQPGQPSMIPGTPTPSIVPEAFMDTSVVNGTAYPYLEVEPRRYRFRILNACNDRFLNLQLYMATGKGKRGATEVGMVPAIPGAGLPPTWPTDGRAGGVPDPATVGPTMIQIGTEGGFLPAPAPLPNQPVDYVYNRRSATVLNISRHTLLMGPAERADVIVDFSSLKAGSTVILYNDAPAPVPGFDPRVDYYTGAPDLTSTGGAPSPLPGYGPNTRTLMQFKVVKPSGDLPLDLENYETTLEKLQDPDTGLPYVFAASTDTPIVPETVYGAATDTYARIQDTSLTFTPAGSDTPVTEDMEAKSIIESFEPEYGRMNAMLGLEAAFTNDQNQTSMWLQYIAPATETLSNGRYQIWKITHNGIDTHAIHFHLFTVQLINRVGWDGEIKPPDANETGWKETVRMNPLEDVIVALKPVLPKVPFSLPNSVRLLNPAMPQGSTFRAIDPDTNQVVNVSNQSTNFRHEYVWHCHLLGHEENDMMRPVVVNPAIATPAAATGLAASVVSPTQVHLNWVDNATNETGFRIERAAGAGAFAAIHTSAANAVSYDDTTVTGGVTYHYRVIAFNGSGDAAASPTWATTSTVAPAEPYNLSVTGSAPDAPRANTLLWNEGSFNEEGFAVQRATDSKFTRNVTSFDAGANTISYTDTTVEPKTKYYYRVRAINSIGSSEYSNVAQGAKLK